MSADALPETFGRFRVIRPLGRGAMGSVYLAEDSLLKREVAVKIPLIDKQANPQVIERFLREAQAAARVHHANVCPVFDVGEQGDGYYLVIPFLEGRPLSHLVGPDRPWEPAPALDLMVKLAGGVQAIHDKGLIHRDLKPGNVMMLADEPVILDLGLARSVAGEDQRLTRTGQPLGTPAYMAPEQLMGELKRLGPATDVHALGVMLHELLTGELPFVGPLHAVYAQILQGEPRAPSATRPGLGRWADTICGKAMARDPGQRYASAEELGRALREYRQALGERTTRDSVCETIPPPFPPVPPTSTDTDLPRAATLAPVESPGGRGKAGPDTRGRRGNPAWLLALAGVPVLVGLLVLLAWGVVSVVGPDRVPTEPPRGPAGGEQAAGKAIPGEAPPAVPLPEPPPPDPMPPQGEPNPPEPPPGEDPPPNPKPPPEPAREITNSIDMKLVLVPAGKFTMGSPGGEAGRGKDEAEHEVEISRPFYLGAFEVTQKQFTQVMGYNPSYFSVSGWGKLGVSYRFEPRGGAEKVKGLDTDSFPVENVSWEEAKEFCQRLSEHKEEKAAGRVYRLPSEAEWEYGCREGGSCKTPFHFGPTLTSDLANFDGNHPYGTDRKDDFLLRTTKMGSYKNKSHALGLFDLHGNVFEWCADWYGPYPTKAAKDPKGPTTGTSRVLRGGCWSYFGHDCRAACRYRGGPDLRGRGLGFRVASSLPRTP